MLTSGTHSRIFVSNCCEVKEATNNMKNQVVCESSTKRRCDSHSCLPKFHVIIDAPLVDYVDIHGLGKKDYK